MVEEAKSLAVIEVPPERLALLKKLPATIEFASPTTIASVSSVGMLILHWAAEKGGSNVIEVGKLVLAIVSPIDAMMP